MATVYGVNSTKARDPKADNIVSPGTLGGNVKVMLDTYEAAALAAGSVIQMGKALPTGAKVIAINLSTDNLANNTTLSVGDAESAARYYAATDHGAGSAKDIWCDVVDGKGYEIDMTTASTPDNQILITTAAGAATGTIKIAIFYTHE